jgi:thymidylate synthase
MRILAVITGDYGARHVANINKCKPENWDVGIYKAPVLLPPIIDYPEDYLPTELPSADLVLSFAEHKGVAELLPDIVRICGGQAVIAPVDNEAWLPRGLARQLRGWLDAMGIVCVTPKPLCTLTENRYRISRQGWIKFDDPLIAAFARHFGQPDLDIRVDPRTKEIVSVEVHRDAVCGCASYVANGLIGVHADDAEEQAGLLHHHYPCLASMGIDIDYGDTLMHISGNIIKDVVGMQVKSFKQVHYIEPGKRAE